MENSPAPSGDKLHTELSLVDAAAFSVGLIGPVGAIGLLGTGAALIIGRAVTLSFVFAVIGVALVAYCFVKLSQHISHTGSVYALVGVTLGPRAGFFAGWALMGAYTAIGCGSTIEIGLFGQQFINNTFHAHITQWWWLALIGLAGVLAICFNEIRIITRALLTSEVIGAILVTVLSIVILAKVIFSHGPQGQTFTINFLVLPHGSGVSTIAKAAVYGFLAFAGFEGAAALGEETSNPKREIPRAIKTAVVVVGAFYLLTAASQSLGYGANAAGAKAYGDGLPFTDLGAGYIGEWYGDILNFMATVSLFAISLGVASGAARILYAQARDATGTRTGLAGLSKNGAPAVGAGRRDHDHRHQPDHRAAGRRVGRERHLLGAAGRHRADPHRLRDGDDRRDPLPVLHGRTQGADVADRDPDTRRRVRLLHDLPQRVHRPDRLPAQHAVHRGRLPGDRAAGRLRRPRPRRSGQGRPRRGDGAVTRVCVQQLDPVVGDLAGNRRLALDAIAEGVDAGAEVIVLPELVTSGYMFESAEEAAANAIAPDHEILREWADLAHRHGVIIAGGFAERGEDGNTYNSAAVFDPTGLRAVYRKLHLWDREKLWFEPGAEPPPVLETSVGRLSVIVCYDVEFPELTRIIALAGHAAVAGADQLAADGPPGRGAAGRGRDRDGHRARQPDGGGVR